MLQMDLFKACPFLSALSWRSSGTRAINAHSERSKAFLRKIVLLSSVHLSVGLLLVHTSGMCYLSLGLKLLNQFRIVSPLSAFFPGSRPHQVVVLFTEQLCCSLLQSYSDAGLCSYDASFAKDASPVWGCSMGSEVILPRQP